MRYADGHQELVFVRDVELVEPPEGVVPSLVRFGFLDEVHRSLRRSVYFGGVAVFKSLGALEDGESVLVMDSVTLGAHHLTNKQVEGGTEVVDAIPGDGTPPGESRLIQHFDPVDQISRIGIVVADESIRLVLLEPLMPGLEVAEVMFGPFDLYPDPGEIRLASHD
jgi:hypothetical protein